jgi:hypothetical protein
MKAPAENYLALFDKALRLVRTESKRGNKSENRQHEAEVFYQLHASRLKELSSASPNVCARHTTHNHTHTQWHDVLHVTFLFC